MMGNRDFCVLGAIAALALSTTHLVSCTPRKETVSRPPAEDPPSSDSAAAASTQYFPREVDRWLEVPPTGSFSDAWLAAARSAHEWQVRLEGKRVVAEPYYYPRVRGPVPPFRLVTYAAIHEGQKTTVGVVDGWLVGDNAGEWGGSLMWFSENGNERYSISDDVVQFFIRSGGELYVAAGLAHLAMDRGTLKLVYRDRDSGKWALRTIVDLGGCPRAGVVDPKGNLLIVTKNLLKVTPSGGLTVVLGDPGWVGLYPNSAVLKAHDALYVGMRQRVARISNVSTKPRAEWLVPRKELLKDGHKEQGID